MHPQVLLSPLRSWPGSRFRLRLRHAWALQSELGVALPHAPCGPGPRPSRILRRDHGSDLGPGLCRLGLGPCLRSGRGSDSGRGLVPGLCLGPGLRFCSGFGFGPDRRPGSGRRLELQGRFGSGLCAGCGGGACLVGGWVLGLLLCGRRLGGLRFAAGSGGTKGVTDASSAAAYQAERPRARPRRVVRTPGPPSA